MLDVHASQNVMDGLNRWMFDELIIGIAEFSNEVEPTRSERSSRDLMRFERSRHLMLGQCL